MPCTFHFRGSLLTPRSPHNYSHHVGRRRRRVRRRSSANWWLKPNDSKLAVVSSSSSSSSPSVGRRRRRRRRTHFTNYDSPQQRSLHNAPLKTTRPNRPRRRRRRSPTTLVLTTTHIGCDLAADVRRRRSHLTPGDEIDADDVRRRPRHSARLRRRRSTTSHD